MKRKSNFSFLLIIQCSFCFFQKKMSAPSFSPNIPNKIRKGIEVSGRNTLIKTGHNWCLAIADEPIDVKVDGKKMFCVRVDNAARYLRMAFGFTSMETFGTNKYAYFGHNISQTSDVSEILKGDCLFPAIILTRSFVFLKINQP